MFFRIVDYRCSSEVMLPSEFIHSMRQQLGLAEADKLFRALEGEAVTSIRLNDKIDELTFDCDTAEIPWNDDGYYLSTRPQFTLDPLFHAGCYYVQEASSMFLQQVLEQYVRRDSVVLDLCAAPGGKSTIISQYLCDEGLLVSNEVIRQRVFILSENIQKWGNGNTVVTHNEPIVFGECLPNLFDCVLVDAPCSGEGMFRKDANAIAEWSVSNVRLCSERQRSIVQDVWSSLKPGGVLIYSTCTFNRKENEDNALWIAENLGAEILAIAYDASWGITEGTPGYHFYPHKTRGEGLYICAFRKRGVCLHPFRVPKSKQFVPKPIEQECVMRGWLRHPEHWGLRQQDRFITAYPLKYKELIDYLTTQLICISYGVGIGEQRGKMVAPQHSLAMLKDFQMDAFSCVELSLEQALSFLRTETIVLEHVPTAIILVTYQNVPLGFVKSVGNRCNNMYPKEWRIRRL